MNYIEKYEFGTIVGLWSTKLLLLSKRSLSSFEADFKKNLNLQLIQSKIAKLEVKLSSKLKASESVDIPTVESSFSHSVKKISLTNEREFLGNFFPTLFQ